MGNKAAQPNRYVGGSLPQRGFPGKSNILCSQLKQSTFKFVAGYVSTHEKMLYSK